MVSLGVAATVFALIFVAELPDKSAIASLVLGTRYPMRWVFTGVAAAFLVHVVIAVAAGSLIGLLPRRPLEALVGLAFLAGAVLLWTRGAGEEDEEEDLGDIPEGAGFTKIAGLSFGVIFLAEWGDLTQILAANLAARYHDPIAVGVGATLGLWAVALVAMLGGKALLRVLPVGVIVRFAAVVMVGLAVLSIVSAVRG